MKLNCLTHHTRAEINLNLFQKEIHFKYFLIYLNSVNYVEGKDEIQRNCHLRRSHLKRYIGLDQKAKLLKLYI